MNTKYFRNSLASVLFAANLFYSPSSRAEGLEHKIMETSPLNLHYEPKEYLAPPLALPTQRSYDGSPPSKKNDSKNGDVLIGIGLVSAIIGVLLPTKSDEPCNTGWKCNNGVSGGVKGGLIGGGLLLAAVGLYVR